MNPLFNTNRNHVTCRQFLVYLLPDLVRCITVPFVGDESSNMMIIEKIEAICRRTRALGVIWFTRLSVTNSQLPYWQKHDLLTTNSSSYNTWWHFATRGEVSSVKSVDFWMTYRSKRTNLSESISNMSPLKSTGICTGIRMLQPSHSFLENVIHSGKSWQMSRNKKWTNISFSYIQTFQFDENLAVSDANCSNVTCSWESIHAGLLWFLWPGDPHKRAKLRRINEINTTWTGIFFGNDQESYYRLWKPKENHESDKVDW